MQALQWFNLPLKSSKLNSSMGVCPVALSVTHLFLLMTFWIEPCCSTSDKPPDDEGGRCNIESIKIKNKLYFSKEISLKFRMEIIHVFISVLTWICFWNELCLRIFDAEEPVLFVLAWPLLSSNVDARISLGSIRRICGMVTSFSGCTLPLMKYVLTPRIKRNEMKSMVSSFHLYHRTELIYHDSYIT